MGLSDRAAMINARAPEFFADVEMYPTDAGGKTREAWPGWGCPAKLDPDATVAWSVWPILGDDNLRSGDKRRLGFVTSHEEARDVLSNAHKFYLWDGAGVVGQANVAADDPKPLLDLFELIAENDDALSNEAAIALRMYVERACTTGPIEWWNEVSHYLELPDQLAQALSVKSLRDIHVHRSDLAKLCFEAMARLPKGGAHAWRYAYLLKRGASIKGLEGAASDYLAQHWFEDEAVATHLLNVIWSDAPIAATLEQILSRAKTVELVETARQRLEMFKASN